MTLIYYQECLSLGMIKQSQTHQIFERIKIYSEESNDIIVAGCFIKYRYSTYKKLSNGGLFSMEIVDYSRCTV